VASVAVRDRPPLDRVVSDRGTADFLCARDNPGDRTTCANTRKQPLTCEAD
jgi:hypothetical protein